MRRDSRYSGGWGQSFEDAIYINCNNTEDGIAAEYEYIENMFEELEIGYRVKRQELNHMENGKSFDVITLELIDKTEVNIYFEVSNFYGR